MKVLDGGSANVQQITTPDQPIVVPRDLLCDPPV